MKTMSDEQLMTVCGGDDPLSAEITWAYERLQEQERKAADDYKLTFAAQGMAQ
jgi:hypothetical protein